VLADGLRVIGAVFELIKHNLGALGRALLQDDGGLAIVQARTAQIGAQGNVAIAGDKMQLVAALLMSASRVHCPRPISANRAKGPTEDALRGHTLRSVFPATEPAQGGVRLDLSDECLGGGDVPEGFGDKGMGHLEVRLGGAARSPSIRSLGPASPSLVARKL
jgi:hypothetical protein